MSLISVCVFQSESLHIVRGAVEISVCKPVGVSSRFVRIPADGDVVYRVWYIESTMA